MAQQERADNGPVRRTGPITLAELTAGLIWPTLLRAAALSIQPPRMLLGIATAIGLWAVATVWDWVIGWFGSASVASGFVWGIRDGWVEAGGALLGGRFVESLGTLAAACVTAPLDAVSQRPFVVALALLLLAPVWAIGGGALSRTIAVDVAGHMNLSPRAAVKYALSRGFSLTSALLIPLVAMALLVFLLKIVGWVLLSVPYLNVVGAVLYGVLIVLGFGLILLGVGFVLGQGMLVPAVAVEGTDAVDAVQRIYAYLLGRPGRALLYIALAVVQALFVIGIAAWFIGAAGEATQALAGSWLPEEKRAALFGPASETVAGQVLGVWNLVLAVLLFGFMISFHFATTTIVYLLLRRVNDEQDVHDVWMPGGT